MGGDFEEDGFEVCEEVFVVFVLLMVVCSYDEFVGLVGFGGLVVFFMLIVFCRGSLDFCVNVVIILVVIVVNIDLYFYGVFKVF